MSAGQYVGRVGGIAAAMSVGVAVFGSTAVAVADTGGPDARGSAVAGADSAPARGPRSATAVKSDAPTALVRARAAAAPNVATLPAPAATTVTLPAPAATTLTVAAPAATQPAASVLTPSYGTTPPNPQATTSTPYGVLGQWMLNKSGQVADWVGVPYCGKGSTSANCKPDTPGAKTMQEPINTIFVVKASSKFVAELKLSFALWAGGFGPSCCSSVGYSAIVGNTTDPQMPHGGLLGLIAGVGPAYRDAPFFLANSHLRTFGGEPDGKGDFVFTASVSQENLDATGGGLLPTHGFESYNVARTTLVDQLVKRSWITGASNFGMVAMNNAISPNDPTYTTGDADGLAQVIAIGSVVASSPAQSISPASAIRPATTVTAV